MPGRAERSPLATNLIGHPRPGLTSRLHTHNATPMPASDLDAKRTFDVADLDAVSSYKLSTGLIVPRPIGWIGTTSESGVHNLAPFSFFNAVAMHPPTFVVAPVTAGGRKDTLNNIEATGVFTVNVVTEDTVEAMNATAATLPADEDEFVHVGLTAITAETSNAPMVGEAVANFECTLSQMIPVGTPTKDQAGMGMLIIGEATKIHIAERVVSDGLYIDQHELRAVGRHVGNWYSTSAGSLFDIDRPA